MSNFKVPHGLVPVPPMPFNEKGELNFDVMEQVLNRLVENKVHWICIGGSSSEYTMMSAEERRQMLAAGARIIGDRTPKMASTGCHYLEHTIELTRYAIGLGYDAIMLLTPYHMYPGRKATVEYYKTMARTFPDTPFVIYNSPGLTGKSIPHDDIVELAKVPNIVGIKYSVDPFDVSRLIEDTKMQDIPFSVMTGDDYMLIVNIAQGGDGVVSYVPTLLPREMVRIYDLMQENNWAAALEEEKKIRHMITLLFSEPSTGPIKAAMSMLGFDYGEPRLPIPPCSEELKEKMRKELIGLGYDVK